MPPSGGADEYDREVGADESPSSAIIGAVSTITDTDPIELPPLYSAIDPDALDRLLEGDGAPTVIFTYEGFEVEATPTGITVTRIES